MNTLDDDELLESEYWKLTCSRSFDDDKSQTPSNTSTGSVWLKNKKLKAEQEASNKVEGVIDLNPKYRDPNKNRVKIGGYMINDLPLMSNGFSYVIHGPVLTSTFFGLPMLHCKRYEATPLPLTLEILTQMLKNSDSVAFPMTESKIDSIIKTLLKLVDENGDSKAQKYAFASSVVVIRKELQKLARYVLRTNEMKQYFFHRELEVLSTLYERRKLVTMDHQDIEDLYTMLYTTPQYLCCRDLYRFEWQVEDPDTGVMAENPTLMDYARIPELDLSALEKGKFTIDPLAKTWIKVYKYVKERYYEEKHSYTDQWMVYNLIKAVTPNEEVAKAAFDFLLKRRVLILDDERVYLYRPYFYERMISNVIGRIYLRYRNRCPVYRNQNEWDIQRALEFKNNFFKHTPAAFEALCDEQQRAFFDLAQVKPLVLISGPGGSGKTHTLKHIIDSHQDGAILVTAFQHKNVGHLQKMCKERNIFFTTHQLIASHAKCCHKSHTRASIDPKKQQQTINMDEKTKLPFKKCILEQIEILIVDEVGLEDTELMAKLLYALACCGKLKSIVFSGDCFQLPSVKPGNFIGDMQQICSEDSRLAGYIEFKHNHRAAYDLLFQNSNFVKAKQPDRIKFDEKIAFQRPFDNDIDALVTKLLTEFKAESTSSHIITYTNDLKDKIDEAAEKFYLGKSVPGYEWKPHVFWPGSKMVLKKSDVSTDKVNNEILIIKRIYDVSPIQPHLQIPVKNTSDFLASSIVRYMECTTMDGSTKTLVLDAQTKKVMRKSYATTNYSFIGDQSDTIFYIIPPYNKRETCRTVYTGFTRASKRLVFVGALSTLKRATLAEEPERCSSIYKYVKRELDLADKKAQERLDGILNKKITYTEVIASAPPQLANKHKQSFDDRPTELTNKKVKVEHRHPPEKKHKRIESIHTEENKKQKVEYHSSPPPPPLEPDYDPAMPPLEPLQNE